jgi:hypothetical protein
MRSAVARRRSAAMSQAARTRRALTCAGSSRASEVPERREFVAYPVACRRWHGGTPQTCSLDHPLAIPLHEVGRPAVIYRRTSGCADAPGAFSEGVSRVVPRLRLVPCLSGRRIGRTPRGSTSFPSNSPGKNKRCRPRPPNVPIRSVCARPHSPGSRSYHNEERAPQSQPLPCRLPLLFQPFWTGRPERASGGLLYRVTSRQVTCRPKRGRMRRRPYR